MYVSFNKKKKNYKLRVSLHHLRKPFSIFNIEILKITESFTACLLMLLHSNWVNKIKLKINAIPKVFSYTHQVHLYPKISISNLHFTWICFLIAWKINIVRYRYLFINLKNYIINLGVVFTMKREDDLASILHSSLVAIGIVVKEFIFEIKNWKK